MSPPTGRKITVEHIMPRNLDDPSELEKYGFDTEEERRDYLNRFGNLSLLYNDENSSAGNGSFTDKTPIYENTEFVLTSTLAKPKESGILDGNETRLFEIINNYGKVYSVENDYWDKTLIETRSKDMADFIVCILKNSFDE